MVQGSNSSGKHNQETCSNSHKITSILHTTNIIKWVRRKLKFRIPDIHSPAPIHATISQTHNTLSVAELQQIATVVIEAQSMAPTTSTVAPTVSRLNFDGNKKSISS